MLTRRDALRGLSLAALAVATPGLLAGCGENGGKDDDVTGSGDLTLVSSDVDRAKADPAAVTGGVASLHALGAGLYGELAGSGGNLAISPFSIVVALGMTLNGAQGTTLEEMLAVCASGSAEELNAGLNAVTQHIESLAGKVKRGDDSDAEIALDAANSLFGQRDVTWESEFLDALAASYGAGMHQVDYIGETEKARVAINEWTAEQTRDKIPEIIGEGLLDALTRLVLVNTLYLKAPWETPFPEGLTEDGPFHLASGSSVDVPFMQITNLGTVLGSGDGWRSGQIPYAGGELAMTVVLPDEGRLADVESAVVAGGLEEILTAGESGQLDLTMPRWTFRSPSPLKDALVALGMPIAFTDDADLSGMTTEEDLHLTAVVHEVFIAVDEEGTEAAAATAVIAGTESMPPPAEKLVLDRPFLFVIHDIEHGTPLFVGRVADPS